MALVVQYRLADGLILGTWQAATVALLEAQIGTSDSTTAYATVDTDVSVFHLGTDYYMLDGDIVPKDVLTITADPSPFTADGVAVCSVSVDPFVACILLVDGVPFALIPEDMALELTSDVPHTFQITLAPLAAYTAAPLSVEAV